MQTTPVQSIMVYGPQGCGKTRNAHRIAKALGLSAIVEEFELGSGHAWPREGALLLSHTPPPNWFRHPVMSFDEAMKRVPA